MQSSSPPPRKAKISLADYPFRRDIETRLLIAQLSVFEVEVLQEIIHHSLKISIEQLAKDLAAKVDILLPILDKLSATKLFKRQDMTLVVDKEMRKYFEVKMEIFDEDFRPDLDFLQNILNKVPIHVLPLWYAIPRSSDNIFESIIEKYFLTPKIYRQHIQELQFDNPILKTIIQEIYQSPQYKVTVAELMVKFDLTHECLEEYLLLLEYHFVCCLSYQRVEQRWQEVVTPFAEWLDYLQFEAQFQARPIQAPIEKNETVEFQFIQDLTTLLRACQTKKILSKDFKGLHSHPSQHHNLVHKLIQMEFVKQSADHLLATEKGRNWILKSLPEQAAVLANDPRNVLSNVAEFPTLWNTRNLHLVEQSLKRLVPKEWIELQHFLRGVTVPIGDQEPVILKNKGKKWKYLLPTYTNLEKQFIEVVIMERLAQLGVVATGLVNGCPCFCLTPFGSHFLH